MPNVTKTSGFTWKRERAPNAGRWRLDVAGRVAVFDGEDELDAGRWPVGVAGAGVARVGEDGIDALDEGL